MKANKKAIFICQLSENVIKVIKARLINNGVREFIGLEFETVSPDSSDEELAQKLNLLFKKLQFSNEPVIVSLPRNLAALRFLKIPAVSGEELEKIVSLQASRYLPYPAEELITAFQAISTDKEGYSDINLTIAHKNVIERYLKIFQGINIKTFTITLSSYGLSNLFNHISPQESCAVMLIDIDAEASACRDIRHYSQVEFVIVLNKIMLFSRYFKLNRNAGNWQGLFIDELNKTKDAYLKEVALAPPVKIVFIAKKESQDEFLRVINEKSPLPAEFLSYEQRLNIPKDLLTKLLGSDYSYASLFGLGLRNVTESLNLLPAELKKNIKKSYKRKESLRTMLLIGASVLILCFGIARDINNKAGYLKRLKKQLNAIIEEARPLEELEKRSHLLEARAKNRVSTVDVLYEVHQLIPDETSLVSFSYEEDNKFILDGQTPQLNSVFIFLAQLEKSRIFKNFNIKVRYATAKKTQQGEVVDFEIVGSKK